MSELAKHPAKYTPKFIPVFSDILTRYNVKRIIDPNAGTCRIAEVCEHGYDGEVYCVDLEREWLSQGFGKVTSFYLGDAEFLPYKDNYFDGACTSPTYANRMADAHDAKDGSRRNTYTHVLGRKLSEGNTGAMQWGDTYRDKYTHIWQELRRVLCDGAVFILNIKDHIRKGEVIPVTAWHIATLESLGFEMVEHQHIDVPSNRMGENGEKRIPYESIVTFTLKKGD